MEENKKGTRKRIVRKAYEGHAEKVDYSTSRSFDSEDRPARHYQPRTYGDKPRAFGDKPRTYGDKPRTYGDKPRTYGDKPAGFADKKARTYGDKPRTFGDRPRKSGYGKPSFGGSAKPYAKRSKAEEGMSAMLSRKPQVNGRYSDDDTVKTEIQEVVRLNKFIANSGVCSRREADTMI